MAVNASAKYMVWLRDHPPSAGRMKSTSLAVVNALAGTGLPDAFRPERDIVHLERGRTNFSVGGFKISFQCDLNGTKFDTF